MKLGLKTKRGLLILTMAAAAASLAPQEANADVSVETLRHPGNNGFRQAYNYEISLVRQSVYAAYDRRSFRPFMVAHRNFRALEMSVRRMSDRRAAYQIIRLIRHTEAYAINNFRLSVHARQSILNQNGRTIINLLLRADDRGRPGGGGGGIGSFPGRGGR